MRARVCAGNWHSHANTATRPTTASERAAGRQVAGAGNLLRAAEIALARSHDRLAPVACRAPQSANWCALPELNIVERAHLLFVCVTIRRLLAARSLCVWPGCKSVNWRLGRAG